MVSTMLVNSVDNVSKKVSTVGLAAETTRRMIVIRWQIVPLRDRVRRGGAAGAQRAAGRPRSPGSVSGRGSTTDGTLHSYGRDQEMRAVTIAAVSRWAAAPMVPIDSSSAALGSHWTSSG